MISIFAKETFLNVNPSEPFRLRTKPVKAGHLMRVSSMIRGDQITDQIGARFNPTEGYENDVCIYVKPMVRRGQDFKFEGRQAYLDMVDGWDLIPLMRKHPEVGIIACSNIDYKNISKAVTNKVVLIPQQSCNFNRVRRNRMGITRIGCIGTRLAFPFLPEGLKGKLAEMGIELEEFSRFFSRQDIIDFYMRIDVQIIWRPYFSPLTNPLKIVNASSFGVPTIALDEEAFKEMEGCYIPVKTLDEFLVRLNELRTIPGLYDDYAKRCVAKSEEYHIEKIGKLYKALDSEVS